MRFKFPKPLNGWRRFSGEVGVIVLGVLIALGADQLVRAMQRSQDRSDTLAGIRAEMGLLLGNFGNRAAISKCIDRRLDEIGSLLDRASGADYRRPSWIGRPQLWMVTSARWNAGNGTGLTGLLSADQQANLGASYNSLAEAFRAELEEQSAWARLRVLEQVDRPSPELVSTLRLALQEARLANWRVKIHVGQARETAGRAGVTGQVSGRRGSLSVCYALDMPRATALQRIAGEVPSPYGEP